MTPKRPLRILLCCQQSPQRYAVPAYAFWAEYFRGAFAEAGHACVEVPDCDWARGLLPLPAAEAQQWRTQTWERTHAFLRREHARQPIDFLLGYFFPAQVDPAAVRAIRDLGIPCVNFFCDNVREFRRIPEVYRPFDLHWVPEYKALALYRAAGLPVLHAPMACWVPPAQRRPVEQETLPVTFTGTRDDQRAALFAAAIRQGLPVELRGPGWESAATAHPSPIPADRGVAAVARRQLDFARQHGWAALARKLHQSLAPRPPLAFDFTRWARPPAFGDAYWPLLRECTVCLGVNRYPSLRFPFDRPDTYSRLRDIEAPMSGACYLTEWTEGIDRLYEPGVEIETYRDAAELVAKAQSLERDPARRRRLRAAGQARALRDHSITATVDRIAATLGRA